MNLFLGLVLQMVLILFNHNTTYTHHNIAKYLHYWKTQENIIVTWITNYQNNKTTKFIDYDHKQTLSNAYKFNIPTFDLHSIIGNNKSLLLSDGYHYGYSIQHLYIKFIAQTIIEYYF